MLVLRLIFFPQPRKGNWKKKANRQGEFDGDHFQQVLHKSITGGMKILPIPVVEDFEKMGAAVAVQHLKFQILLEMEMRSPKILALMFCLLCSSISTGQDLDAQRKLSEIQKRIDRLNAELEAIKLMQTDTLPEPIQVDPIIEDPIIEEPMLGSSVLERDPVAPVINQPLQPTLAESSWGPSPYPPYQGNYSPVPSYSAPAPQFGGGNQGYPPTIIQTPAVYHHAMPVFGSPGFIDPGFRGGYGGPSVYLGPRGWGVDIGGIQLNFRGGHTHRGSGRGRGHRN